MDTDVEYGEDFDATEPTLAEPTAEEVDKELSEGSIGEGEDLKLSDKASFRDKASLLKVLEESSRHRRLPEPTGSRPGQLADGLTPRPLPKAGMEPDSEGAGSPRTVGQGLKLPPYTPRHLTRGRNLNQLGAEGADAEGSELEITTPLTARLEKAKGNKAPLSLPPVAAGRSPDKAPRPKMENIMTYSRHSTEILARLKQGSTPSSPAADDWGPAPGSPGLARAAQAPVPGGVIRKAPPKDLSANKISLEDTQSLTPRLKRK